MSWWRSLPSRSPLLPWNSPAKQWAASGALYAGGSGVERGGNLVDLILAQRATRNAQSQREPQILHRAQDLWRGAATLRAASLGHAGEEGVHGRPVGGKMIPSLRCDCMQLLATLASADRHLTEFLKQRQRWIDHARAWAVGAPDLLLYRLDELVTVPRLLGDEVEDDQAKVTMGEEAAEPGTAAAATVSTMSAGAAVIAMIRRGRSAGVVRRESVRRVSVYGTFDLRVCFDITELRYI